MCGLVQNGSGYPGLLPVYLQELLIDRIRKHEVGPDYGVRLADAPETIFHLNHLPLSPVELEEDSMAANPLETIHPRAARGDLDKEHPLAVIVDESIDHPLPVSGFSVQAECRGSKGFLKGSNDLPVIAGHHQLLSFDPVLHYLYGRTYLCQCGSHPGSSNLAKGFHL